MTNAKRVEEIRSGAQHQAISISIARMRRLPALEMPCSCSVLPLLNGVPVNPTAPASSRRLGGGLVVLNLERTKLGA
jgi:hypothetical protein